MKRITLMLLVRIIVQLSIRFISYTKLKWYGRSQLQTILNCSIRGSIPSAQVHYARQTRPLISKLKERLCQTSVDC